MACKGCLEYTVEDFEEFYQLARAADVVYTDGGAYFPHVIPDLGSAGWAAVWYDSAAEGWLPVWWASGPVWSFLPQASGAAE